MEKCEKESSHALVTGKMTTTAKAEAGRRQRPGLHPECPVLRCYLAHSKKLYNDMLPSTLP